MSEWLKEHDWKSCVRANVPWVQIPHSPPQFKSTNTSARKYTNAGKTCIVVQTGTRVFSCRYLLLPYWDHPRMCGGILKGDLNYEEWYNKYVKGYEEPTGKGDWKFNEDGTIVTTKDVPILERYSSRLKEAPNDVISYGSKGGPKGQRQINLSLYDENGFLAKQIHYGNHGQPKRHNFGTKENPVYEHTHEVVYVDNVRDLSKETARAATDEEKRYLNGRK